MKQHYLRSTREVLEDHVSLRYAGKIEEDIARNYHPDCLLLLNHQFFLGHAGLRAMNASLNFCFPDLQVEFTAPLTHGRVGFLEPVKNGEGLKQSFMVENGLIVTHIIHD